MEELDASSVGTTASHAPSTQVRSKSGQQLLHELLALAYQVFEEAKHINLKAPLRPSSKLFTPAANVQVNVNSPAPTGNESPQDENAETSNGSAAMVTSTSSSQPVIPYSPEEIQDSYTKMDALKNQYMKISGELSELLKKDGSIHAPNGAAPTATDGSNSQDTTAKLLERRNQLRKEVYERNVVMKGLIDRLRQLQASIRILNGGRAYAPNVVMESI